jgi:hypothetical protein
MSDHIDPFGCKYSIACILCGRVHKKEDDDRVKAEREAAKGKRA